MLSVLRQPAGDRAGGTVLVLDLAWSGVSYGVVDALLLTVLPVAAVFGAFGRNDEREGGTVVMAASALGASPAVTAAMHGMDTAVQLPPHG